MVPNLKFTVVIYVKSDMAIKDLVLDSGLGLGLTILGVVCSYADVVGINSYTRKSSNVKIGL